MLKGKLALVTGAASGIGSHIAQLFAKQGARVCLVDVQNELLLKVASQIDNTLKHSTHLCDVSNSIEVNHLFTSIKQQYPEFKVPSIIVNSAGITRDATLLKLSEQDWNKVIDVNLKGTFLVTQAAARELVFNYPNESQTKDTYASIINIASIIGKQGQWGQANYAASKAGVEGFTKTVAKELGKYQIRCNAILPGFIQTPMTDFVQEKQLKAIIRMVPLKRIGQPEEIAQLSLFLASDVSSYITGASIDINGGLSI